MDTREEFEKLEDVKQGLRHCHYNESANDYHADVAHEETHEWHTQFVNGAWYAFQEQQKKIDALKAKIEDITKWSEFHIEDYNLSESDSDHDRGWFNAACQVFKSLKGELK